MKHHRSIDLKAISYFAMQKYGFKPEFPKAVIREVNALHPDIPEAVKDGQDLRALLWSSIDNFDSEDLDQMEYCERGPGDEIQVKIAIADVDHYVPKHSQADQYASYNGTSVYTGIVTYPMLPDRLSKGISSLLPEQDCRAVVIEYAVLPDGSVRHGSLYRAIVANKAKLIYEEVGDWLEGAGPVPELIRDTRGLEAQVRLQHEAALRLKKFRTEQGALELETIEPEPIVKDGTIKDLIVQKKNLARNLIEEFMVAANGTTVAFLGAAGIPMIQRIVRIPKHWDGIMLTAEMYGEILPDKPDAKALTDFLSRRKEADPERFPDLSLTVVKLMGAGEYVPLDPAEEPIGHFALAVTDYTHGTAPNRRYVDLIIQRLVKTVLDKTESPYTLEELVSQSTWLTEKEKESKKVERFMRKAAAAVLLQDRIGTSFDALVTGASDKGTYVRLITPPAEGRVMQGQQGLRVGEKVRVRLLKTDPMNGYVDFACTGRA
ncbi:MAG: ribonuclease II [Methanomicrobiales archaeon HGW-Methanomicrobiales-1]|jgi:exoribonuclease-2|nr:MAG: ribonuclease II [Methanomicrobiales archaeon HGW-Methanomicrobiales-1]